MDSQLSHSLAKFAVLFCNELGMDKTTVSSPLSAEILLSMVALSCKGKSHEELLKTLGFPDDEAIRSSFSYLTTTLQSIEGATLNMANNIYLKKGSELNLKTQKDAKEVFGSNFEQVDFNEGETAAGLINKWVMEKTDGMIKKAVSAEMFNEQASLILDNAIYFQGNWEWPFKKRRTKLRKFHINNTTKINVPQMYQTNFFFYGVIPELKAKILEMCYQGKKSSMVLVLPDEIEGLSYVMDKLTAGYDLVADLKYIRYTKVEVTVPKFNAEITIDLRNLLSKLGIKSIFAKDASHINMLTSNEMLFVSEAIQKAFIVVDEIGTKAAAATLIPESQCSSRYPRFAADRPFLYLLMTHKVPIFIGVYEVSEYAQIKNRQK